MKFRLQRPPPESIRHFAFEMVTIVLGVLIALSFDGLADWRRERNLVREAVANIEHELRDNRADVEKSMRKNVENKRRVDVALEEFERMVAAGTGSHLAKLSLSTADLMSTSWDTAQSIGALKNMPYADVKRFTEIYVRQRDVARLQERMLDHFVTIINTRPVEIATLSPPERVSRRNELLMALKHMRVVSDLQQNLIGHYDQVLSRGSAPRPAPPAAAPAAAAAGRDK